MQRQRQVEWQTIQPNAPAEQLDPVALRKIFAEGGRLEAFLGDAAKARQRVLLIVNDSHRATPTRQVLDILSTVTRSLPLTPRVRALVATGTHHFSDTERRQFEEATFGGCELPIEQVTWHDALDSTGLAELNGVRINRLVPEHRFLMPIGSVEPHYFAGTTGAHKTATIGCLSHEDIERNHAAALSVNSEIMRLDGNPVFDGMVSILEQLARREIRILAINTVTDQGRILGASVGGALDTLRALMPLVRATFVHRIDDPVDLVHLKVPAPLGRSFYQADKALKNCQSVVRRGGGIILEAACTDGIGPDAFMDLLGRAPDYATACQIIRKEGYRLGDHKAAKLLYLTDPQQRDVRIALVAPRVADSRLERIGVRATATVQDALDWLGSAVKERMVRGILVEDAGVMSVTASDSP